MKLRITFLKKKKTFYFNVYRDAAQLKTSQEGLLTRKIVKMKFVQGINCRVSFELFPMHDISKIP